MPKERNAVNGGATKGGNGTMQRTMGNELPWMYNGTTINKRAEHTGGERRVQPGRVTACLLGPVLEPANYTSRA